MAVATNDPHVQALLFDVYGTLFDVNSVNTACEEAFPGRGRELSRLWRAKQLEYTYLLSLMERFQDFWQVTGTALGFACQALGLECGSEVRERLMDQYFRLEPFPDVPEALAVLSGHPLYILSNGSPKMLHTLVESAGLQKYFTRIISASEVRKYKPSPAIYRWGAEKTGLDPALVALVSANAWDVSGAKSFGCQAFWINRTGAPWDNLGFAPDVTVPSLSDLAAVLLR
jgi:2-haloacid dehalogenase